MSAVMQEQTSRSTVLTKAVINAGAQLGLSHAELAKVLGVHRTSLTRLKRTPGLDPNTKAGEIALLLVRIHRALYALAGGDQDWMKHFMRSKNHLTRGIPADQIQSIQGLSIVLQFVDGIRGKV